MKKIVFLDRDGVINVDVAYLHSISEFKWVLGVKEALALAKSKGYEFIVVTNQSGIARGYFTVEDMHTLHRHIEEELLKVGIPILHFYYCPHLEDGIVKEFARECNCRKPKPGMILQALHDYDINKEESFLIGDSSRDIEAAKAAGIKGYLYKEGNLKNFMQDILSGENVDEGL